MWYTKLYLLLSILLKFVPNIETHLANNPFDRYLPLKCGTKTKFTMSRTVSNAVVSQWQDEGMGARVRRSIGRPELRKLDPFLLLDEFKGEAPAGFPDHPHRGFETVTYVLEGQVRHEDFCGHKGIIGPGDLQWMTAGKGIVHCEMPHGKRPVLGMQLWVNLSKQDKMIEPSYQELLDKVIPRNKKEGVWVKVIAGESMDMKSPVYTRTPTLYLHIKMDEKSKYKQAIPKGWNAFVYTLSGSAYFGPSGKQHQGQAHTTLIFTDGDSLEIETKDEKCDFLVIGGQPLNEPVVQHGPFVMNTAEEIQQTFSDYRQGKNGFENAPKWQSHYYKSGPFVMNTEEEIKEAQLDYQHGRNGFEGARTWNSFIVGE